MPEPFVSRPGMDEFDPPSHPHFFRPIAFSLQPFLAAPRALQKKFKNFETFPAPKRLFK